MKKDNLLPVVAWLGGLAGFAGQAAQDLCAGSMVHIIHAVFTHGERKHICRAVFTAVLCVQFTDLLVIHKGNADLSRIVKLFHTQHSMAAATNEHTDTCGDLDRFLIVRDDNSDFFHIAKSFR